MKTRILIAEDDPVILDALERLLTKAGYTVITASNGTDALRLIYTREYDLAIIDLTLIPGPSGRQLIVKIREFDHVLPIIVLTADQEEVAETDTVGYGIDLFIQKPFRSKALLAWIERLVSRNATPKAHILHFNQGDLDTHNRIIIPHESEPFQIPYLQMRLLELMIRSRNIRFTYEKLIEEVWGEAGKVLRNTVQKAMSRLNTELVAHGLLPVTKDIENEGYEFTGKNS